MSIYFQGRKLKEDREDRKVEEEKEIGGKARGERGTIQTLRHWCKRQETEIKEEKGKTEENNYHKETRNHLHTQKNQNETIKGRKREERTRKNKKEKEKYTSRFVCGVTGRYMWSQSPDS